MRVSLLFLLLLSFGSGFVPPHTATRTVHLYPSVKSRVDGHQRQPTSARSALFAHSKPKPNRRASHSTLQSTAVPQAPALPPVKPGRAHTAESRAKISAANKGKKPWNAGVKHSQATRDKIREGVLRKLKEKGYVPKPKKEEGAKSKRGGPLSDEVKEKISEAMKMKWSNTTFREERLAALRASRNAAAAKRGAVTRVKISESLKRRWQDPVFRERQMTIRAEKGLDKPSLEVRRKISKSLKHRWKDEAYRQTMMARMKRRRASQDKARKAVVAEEADVGSEKEREREREKEKEKEKRKEMAVAEAPAVAQACPKKTLKAKPAKKTPPPSSSPPPAPSAPSSPEFFDDFEPPPEELVSGPRGDGLPRFSSELDMEVAGIAGERLNEINRDLWNLIYGDDDEEEEDEEGEDEEMAYAPLSRVR
mmetsp:Transcript_16523/g.33671  ORF Transcript_16523/g.33671 Transcript_16523/m.33671 type:complete len:422 (-) Transcript_16523:50-1315(-)